MGSRQWEPVWSLRAGDGIRTHDTLLGKQMRYHCATPAGLDTPRGEYSTGWVWVQVFVARNPGWEVVGVFHGVVHLQMSQHDFQPDIVVCS